MADPQVKNLAYQALGASLAQTAANPAISLRQVEMRPTPRSPRMGMFADAMMAVRDFANRLQIPQGVPLIGGEGVGSLLMGRAPEELVEMSYGNMPVRVNPYAGRTAGFMPEMKPGRGVQVADLLSLAGVPGGGRTAAAAMGAIDTGADLASSALNIVRPGNPIQAAVVLIGDKMFLGRTHGDALNRAIYEGVVRKQGSKYIYPEGAEVDMDLFMTNDGRIIDRLSAYSELDAAAAETAIEKGLMQNTPARSMTVESYMEQARKRKQEQP